MAKWLSPWVILLIVVIAVPGFLGLCVLSVSESVVGILEQREADNTYVVGFAHSGDDCNASVVSFDLADGAVRTCAQFAATGSEQAGFPGFSHTFHKSRGGPKSSDTDGMWQRMHVIVDALRGAWTTGAGCFDVMATWPSRFSSRV